MPKNQETDSLGERRARFAALARLHEADLMRAALRLCRGNHTRAQDLVQDTLVRAYQAFLDGRFDGSHARAWLIRILTNLFINDHRRRRKWDADLDIDTLTASGNSGPVQTHAAPDDVPGVRLLAATLDEELERALAQLSEPLRLCVMLVDMEGLEYTEAAAALGVPVGTIRSRLSRARMQLHDLLQEFVRQRGFIR